MANKKANSISEPEKVSIDVLYMTPFEVSAKDIAALLQDVNDITVDLWEEMNVLELELPNKNSVDFELLDASFKDPSDEAFVKNRSIKTIFAISLCESDLTSIIPYFEQITAKYSGFLCADSADFTPVYVGTSKR